MAGRELVGFAGLGAMGLGMATNLVKAGFEVVGADINQGALDRLEAAGGKAAPHPAAAAEGVRLFFVMVVNDAQADQVLFGDNGAAAALAPGAAVVLCSTVAADYVRRLAGRLEERGILLIDAPVSGGAIGAASGKLSIMASGPDAAFEAAGPALDACAARVHRLGEAPGLGAMVKAVNQLLAGVHLVTAAEAMAFGVAQGADPKVLFDIIKDAAGGSWMFSNRVPHMLENDYTPRSAVNIWPKDLGLVLDAGRALKMPLPMAAAAHQMAMMAAALGLGEIDDAGLVKVYERFTGAKIVPDGPGEANEPEA